MPLIPFEPKPTVAPAGASGVVQNIRADSGSFGAHTARGLSQIASATERVGAAGEQAGSVLALNAIAFQKQQNETDVDAANTVYESKRREMLFGDGGFYTKKGKDAYDSMTPTSTAIEELREESRKALTNPEQQKMFDSISRRATQMDLRSMSMHAATENQVYRVGVAKASIGNELAESAAYWNDPYRFAVSLGKIRVQAENLARLEGRSDPEQIKYDTAHYVGEAWQARIRAVAQNNPMLAEQMYRANSSEIPDVRQRVALEHELKSAVLPVEAKNLAQSIIARTVAPAPAAEPKMTPVGGKENFPKESPAEALSRAQSSLSILKTEQTERPNDESLKREIGRTEALIADLGSRGADQQAGLVPTTARDTRAQLSNWIPAAEKEAERMRPGDPVFRDMVLTQIKGYVNTIVAAQEGVAKQAHGTLMAAAMGVQGGAKPMTVDGLLSTPEAKQAWMLSDPQSQRGILSLLEHNAKEARGEFTRSNPQVVNDLFSRIHLPEGDPNQIRSASQLAPYFASGLNRSDYDWLRKEIDENQKPEGNMFLKDVVDVEKTAHRMLMGKATLLMQPDVGEDAAKRFRVDLRQKIEQYRKDGKDPRTLLTPGTPDYVASPERVASFMPNAKTAIADAAKKVPYEVGKTYDFKQGKMKFKGGDATDQANWEMVK